MQRPHTHNPSTSTNTLVVVEIVQDPDAAPKTLRVIFVVAYDTAPEMLEFARGGAAVGEQRGAGAGGGHGEGCPRGTGRQGTREGKG